MPPNSRKAKKRTASRPARSTEYRMRARAGQPTAGHAMTPDGGGAATMTAGPPEVREPRPYRNRHPIPDAEFARLKNVARSRKLPQGRATAAVDPGTGRELAATMVAPHPASVAPEPAAAPTGAASFAGIPDTQWIPPDCTMAVGPDHVLLAVNSSLAIFNKGGGAPLLQRTLTQWYANVIQGLTIFDPKALYDQHAGRWVLLAPAFKRNPNQSVFLLSVSASANPLGQWRNYVLDAMVDGNTATNNWADYPGLGVDNQAFYVTANMFVFGGDFQYAKIRVIPKAGPYAGASATFFDFVRMKNADGTTAFTVHPCHTYGAPQVQYLLNSGFPGGNALTLWRITNPTAPVLARATVPISPYSLPPNADQKGGPEALNTGDVRIQHAVFRGDSVWAALSTVRNWGAGNRASIHWVQLRAAANALVQEGVYGTRDAHYFYPAACPDNNGNLVMVFSRSSATEFGTMAYTGRRSTDPLGSLQPSTLVKAGAAHYQRLDSRGRNRWGDYNGVAADPSTPRVIWFASEFASATDTWATWIGSAFF